MNNQELKYTLYINFAGRDVTNIRHSVKFKLSENLFGEIY